MRYHVLATDYDGTLAWDGQVDDQTIDALKRLRASGRYLILVTGRLLEDLLDVFPEIDLFDRVVAENGAVLYEPRTRELRAIAEPPDPRFVDFLRERRIEPLSVGHVIVGTWEPNEATVLEGIRQLGLELEVIFNKGAVMILPAGVTKASGLGAALDAMGLSGHNVVAVGDAENDHAFMAACEASAAVANALPALKERADLVTSADHGRGLTELVDRLIATDLADLRPALSRHRILLGRAEGQPVSIEPYGQDLLVAGPSGTGKSTLVAGALERFVEAGYQFCLVDPEGDYEQLAGAVVLGDETRPPSAAEAVDVLRKPNRSLILNLLGVPLDDRPAFFVDLLPHIQELRAKLGHPHWLVIDEAHHLMPASWTPASETLPLDLEAMVLITVHPEHVAPSALRAVDVVVAVGDEPGHTLGSFVEGRSRGDGERAAIPKAPDGLAPGKGLYWEPAATVEPIEFEIEPVLEDRNRHRRKYAVGELPPDRSFYFRGPTGALNLRAQNLQLFVQLANGVDDATWQHHLGHGDYSRWIREFIKDGELADRVEAVERSGGTPSETRAEIGRAIEERYTAAA